MRLIYIKSIKDDGELRYPIVNTSINLYLTNTKQSPTLSKYVLLSLVDLVKKYHSRSSYIGIYGMGQNSHAEPSSSHSPIRDNFIKEIANVDDKHGRSK